MPHAADWLQTVTGPSHHHGSIPVAETAISGSRYRIKARLEGTAVAITPGGLDKRL